MNKRIEVLNSVTADTFGVVTKRSNKLFDMSSGDINGIVGSHIVEMLGKKGDLTVPDAKVYIEICEKEAFG